MAIRAQKAWSADITLLFELFLLFIFLLTVLKTNTLQVFYACRDDILTRVD